MPYCLIEENYLSWKNFSMINHFSKFCGSTCQRGNFINLIVKLISVYIKNSVLDISKFMLCLSGFHPSLFFYFYVIFKGSSPKFASISSPLSELINFYSTLKSSKSLWCFADFKKESS